MSGSHEHAHADAAMLATDRGVWAVKISILGLFATALIQGAVVAISGSAALLADTLHNFGDAATGIPLLIAFGLSRRQATRRYTYGYHRAEDLAGIIILVIILASAVASAWASYDRLVHPRLPDQMPIAMLAALIGFAGNEAVARLRISVGKEIGSAALVADGQHARTDSFTSIGAFLGILGAFLGFQLADPLVGLVISALILLIVVREAGPPVLARLMDAMEPEVVADIERRTLAVPGVESAHTVRARWLGHQMRAELEIGVDGDISVAQGHAIAEDVRHQLLHDVPRLTEVVVHVDPTGEHDAHAGTAHHFGGGDEQHADGAGDGHVHGEHHAGEHEDSDQPPAGPVQAAEHDGAAHPHRQ